MENVESKKKHGSKLLKRQVGALDNRLLEHWITESRDSFRSRRTERPNRGSFREKRDLIEEVAWQMQNGTLEKSSQYMCRKEFK